MTRPETGYSVCPHDCPSTCALDVEIVGNNRIGRIHGARDNTYTDGVICAKVARYAERQHHPDRVLTPLRRVGDAFQKITWDDALDEVAEHFLKAEQAYGSEAVWPYFYAGTMGLVMRDGINRLRNVKKYSGQHGTICSLVARTAIIAGVGHLSGPDPREMSKSDLVIIWGTNPVATQVNVMTHAIKARKDRDAKIVHIDTYRNATAEQADLFLPVRPGTDGALACAVMHVLFRDGFADWEYLEKYTDAPRELENHVRDKTPAWAHDICGTPVEDIETFARLIGQTPKSFFRLGYGFTRQRNGVTNMHAASSIAAITGAWKHEGGGCFHSNGDIYHWDKNLIWGLDALDPEIRVLDMSRIGPVLTGDKRDLGDGPPVTAMLIQSTNPMAVAPDQNLVHDGFNREDLFVCVHEQFMTDTAKVADIVLPATTFLEHDDIYQGGGHQHIITGPRVVDAPGECLSNHDVVCALAKRLGVGHPGFDMTAAELADATLKASGWPGWDELVAERWHDCQPDFESSHFLGGFGHADGKFRFKPDWAGFQPARFGPDGCPDSMPALPDHWDVIENASDAKPFRLVTAPARNFLNSTFTETETSRTKERCPTVKMHPDDAGSIGVNSGQSVTMGNDRGQVVLEVEIFDGVLPGVVIAETIWGNTSFAGGIGINALTGADPSGPVGGAPFHDNAVWITPVS